MLLGALLQLSSLPIGIRYHLMASSSCSRLTISKPSGTTNTAVCYSDRHVSGKLDCLSVPHTPSTEFLERDNNENGWFYLALALEL